MSVRSWIPQWRSICIALVVVVAVMIMAAAIVVLEGSNGWLRPTWPQIFMIGAAGTAGIALTAWWAKIRGMAYLYAGITVYLGLLYWVLFVL